MAINAVRRPSLTSGMHMVAAMRYSEKLRPPRAPVQRGCRDINGKPAPRVLTASGRNPQGCNSRQCFRALHGQSRGGEVSLSGSIQRRADGKAEMLPSMRVVVARISAASKLLAVTLPRYREIEAALAFAQGVLTCRRSVMSRRAPEYFGRPRSSGTVIFRVCRIAPRACAC